MNMEAHDLALKYLNKRDRTAFEIRRHLESKGIAEEEIGECLEYLSECGLVNDGDYCEKYILYGMEKGRGPLRLERDLMEKGIDPDVIKTGLGTHFGPEIERKAALLHVEKFLRQDAGKSRESSCQSDKELARIGRRLASQGYHSHVIYEILGGLRG